MIEAPLMPESLEIATETTASYIDRFGMTEALSPSDDSHPFRAESLPIPKIHREAVTVKEKRLALSFILCVGENHKPTEPLFPSHNSTASPWISSTTRTGTKPHSSRFAARSWRHDEAAEVIGCASAVTGSRPKAVHSIA